MFCFVFVFVHLSLDWKRENIVCGTNKSKWKLDEKLQIPKQFESNLEYLIKNRMSVPKNEITAPRQSKYV